MQTNLLLRYPVLSSATERLPRSPTAATRSGRSSRPRRRSHRSPAGHSSNIGKCAKIVIFAKGKNANESPAVTSEYIPRRCRRDAPIKSTKVSFESLVNFVDKRRKISHNNMVCERGEALRTRSSFLNIWSILCGKIS